MEDRSKIELLAKIQHAGGGRAGLVFGLVESLLKICF